MPEIVGTFARTELWDERANCSSEARNSSRRDLTEERLEFAVRQFDWIEVGRVFRQVAQRRRVFTPATARRPERGNAWLRLGFGRLSGSNTVYAFAVGLLRRQRPDHQLRPALYPSLSSTWTAGTWSGSTSQRTRDNRMGRAPTHRRHSRGMRLRATSSGIGKNPTFMQRVRAMGIRDKPIASASPWQNGFAATADRIDRARSAAASFHRFSNSGGIGPTSLRAVSKASRRAGGGG